MLGAANSVDSAGMQEAANHGGDVRVEKSRLAEDKPEMVPRDYVSKVACNHEPRKDVVSPLSAQAFALGGTTVKGAETWNPRRRKAEVMEGVVDVTVEGTRKGPESLKQDGLCFCSESCLLALDQDPQLIFASAKWF